MTPLLANTLAFINDVLQAAVVIFGSAIILYNLRHSLRDRVTRAFLSLLSFVVVVYLSDLMVNRTIANVSTDLWLRWQWFGIAMLPGGLFHLADALLITTGDVSRPRRLLIRLFYTLGLAILGIVIYTPYLVGELVPTPRAPRLAPGPFLPLFAIYFWGLTAIAIYLIWRARQRSLLSTPRRRMTVILGAIIAAPLAVYPYLTIIRNNEFELSLFLWIMLIAGNLFVGTMFSFLTYYLAYFGAVTPDRVVRVRLFKFMARVPLAGMAVLLVQVVLNRTPLFGLNEETAVAFATVATVMLLEWIIHAGKRPLERLFQLNNDPDVRRIQELSERLLTTRDLHQFLESVLTTACNTLRTPTAFVATLTGEKPHLEFVVGSLISPENIINADELSKLAPNPTLNDTHNPQDQIDELANDETPFTIQGGFILWNDYWIRRLYNRTGDSLLGILGIQARADQPDLSPAEHAILGQLVSQAAAALEDRFLQQDVFAAVEGLLPQITALQQRRSIATYGNTAGIITSPEDDDDDEPTLLDDPDFVKMVRDALTHYWGGPKLTNSPLGQLQIVQDIVEEHEGNVTNALRDILARAIEQQKPEGERNLTTAEWILYNILELKFVQGRRVRDVARRLAMSESDLYRKQRIAIENVAQVISQMERASHEDPSEELPTTD
ncbi:MAG TPA: hypothetical protein VLL52_01580 [Anaerolineae bacterium]|nr:hypothetical protein [Anaerolineae bacterium]